MFNNNQEQHINNKEKNNIWREVLFFDINKPNATSSNIFFMAIVISIILYLIKFIIIKQDIQLGFKSNSIMTNTLIVAVPVIYTQVFFSFFLLKVLCVHKLKMNIHVAILFTSLIFACTGYEWWFSSPYDINTINNKVIYIFIVAVFSFYSYYYTNNIITPIIIFFLYKYINISANKKIKK
jgi:membrane protease YdiL (CAAX protease family)